jgi:hypothetical protein
MYQVPGSSPPVWAQRALQIRRRTVTTLPMITALSATEVVGYDDCVRAAAGDHRPGSVQDRAGGGAVSAQRQVRAAPVHLEDRLEGAQQPGDRSVLGTELDKVLGRVSGGPA